MMLGRRQTMKTKTLRQRLSNAVPEAKMTRYHNELRRRKKTERQNKKRRT